MSFTRLRALIKFNQIIVIYIHLMFTLRVLAYLKIETLYLFIFILIQGFIFKCSFEILEYIFVGLFIQGLHCFGFTIGHHIWMVGLNILY